MSYNIAVSADGDKLDDMVDQFGRCEYFIISEIENDKIKNYTSIQNPSKTQLQGAGIGAAQAVANENIEAIISTRIGVKTYQVMQQASIDMYLASGKVEDAIMDYIHKNLNPTVGGPNMKGRSGLGRGQGYGGRGSGYGDGQGRQGESGSGRGQGYGGRGSGYGDGQRRQGGSGSGRGQGYGGKGSGYGDGQGRQGGRGRGPQNP